MNFFNKLLCFVILLILINNLSQGKVLTTCKEKMETFFGIKFYKTNTRIPLTRKNVMPIDNNTVNPIVNNLNPTGFIGPSINTVSNTNPTIETFNNPDRVQKKPIEKKAMAQAKELANRMNNTFNEHFVNRDKYDDLFIKPTKHVSFDIQNDSEDSLIPTVINLSD